MDGVTAPTLGKSEVLALLTASGRPDQSHRLAPMLWSGPTAETKPQYPMLAGGLWSWHNPNGRTWSEEMRCVMAESSPHFLSSPEQHRVNDTEFDMLWSQRHVSRVVRAVDITDGQLYWLDLQGRRRRRAPRQHQPDFPLEYELRPQKGMEVEHQPCCRFRQIIPSRENEISSLDT